MQRNLSFINYVRMAERSKALRSGCSLSIRRIPLLTKLFILT